MKPLGSARGAAYLVTMLFALAMFTSLVPPDAPGDTSTVPKGELKSPEAVQAPRLRQHFLVKFRDVISPYEVLGVFVLPGEGLDLEVVGEGLGPGCHLFARAGQLEQRGPDRWRWNAPLQKGLYPLRLLDPVSRDSTRLNVFVMVPYSRLRDGALNGYRIGRYPSEWLSSGARFEPPEGFVEVTAENRQSWIAPHFQLGQFVCKQADGEPKYVVLQEKLLLELESILERLQAAGYPASTLHVMSGYRTPYYNRSLGNVRFSMHQWGGAADIFVDRDGDSNMDDLNRDGRVDRRDAAFLYDLIDASSRLGSGSPYNGGLAFYDATDSHGPFVHVDVRGRAARWGS